MNVSPARAALVEALFASLIFIGLLLNVRSAASTLSGDEHQCITARTERDEPLYQQLAMQLERIRQAVAGCALHLYHDPGLGQGALCLPSCPRYSGFRAGGRLRVPLLSGVGIG
ncbi:hypothetical protein [Dickeya oryzae]|uniref:Uncharacterized protein n=1 Tax=Dickeya oryzae TaxID=1240404 RepID=A0AB39IPG9_9GAMM|nr:hypothetical protein [Dickeya oryzae]MCA6990254.1 hypothetical protein [Dickeya oryzae]